jgi:hypothetical protein
MAMGPRQLVCVALVVGVAVANLRFDPVSYIHEPEVHHSLHPPLDKSQVYWNYGGSTVVSSKLIRVTPDTQDRKGWLWNEYPLEAENWEVEFRTQIWSKPHFGGDGMGFWILAGDQDPTFSSEPDFLNGPVFGMKSDFDGFGVVFDIYDNDQKRNNPAVYVFENFEGAETKFNHDNDFQDDMVKTKPGFIISHFAHGDVSNKHSAHTCVADVRNTGKDVKVLVKFLLKVLHVYVDVQDGQGYKFCLAVTLGGRSFVDYHIAFTAATGQVADNHDITHITTRYLQSTDAVFDDNLLEAMGESKKGGFMSSASRWLIFFISLFLLGLSGYEVYIFGKYQKMAAKCCMELNSWLVTHWGTHIALTFLLLFRLNWYGFFLNLPLIIWRGFCFSGGQYKHTDSSVTGFGVKGHGVAGISSANRLYITLGAYLVMTIYYVYVTFMSD